VLTLRLPGYSNVDTGEIVSPGILRIDGTGSSVPARRRKVLKIKSSISATRSCCPG